MNTRSALLALALVAPLSAQLPYKGFNPANIDPTVKPCQDFFQYAVGGWAKRTAIPAEYERYGVDQEIDTRTYGDTKIVMARATIKKDAPGPS